MSERECDCNEHYLQLCSYDKDLEPFCICVCYVCGRQWARVKEYRDTGVTLYADGKAYARIKEAVWKEKHLINAGK